jgi:L-seryl-tRNA(Ser) seleniumtransferase
VADRRKAILAGEAADGAIAAGEVAAAAESLARPSLRRVINATGVVLHTNLGRAPLAGAAIDAVGDVARGYANLEYDLERGERGSRHGHLAGLLRDLTGAEDALVVNNNAAACLVALAALAAGREVIVSRGELVEIGGSFRVPDILRASGCKLVEVGTTNKTRLRDYEIAIGAETALLLKVHRSNFAIVGFTEEAGLAEVAALARARGVTSMIDLGSGALDDGVARIVGEPTVGAAIAAGADVVCFSGDKLLGGPQAGVIVGRAAAIARVRNHPLVRAMRPDKLTIAALHTTLALYREGFADQIPTIAMLTASPDVLRARAETLVAAIGQGATLVETTSAVGGGASPLAELPSWGVALDGSASAIERGLRKGKVPVIARVADDRVILDVRTIADGDIDHVAAAARAARC